MMSSSGYKKIKLPNGKTVQFPESMANEEIERVLQQHFPQQMKQSLPQENNALSQIAGSAPIQGILGAGDALHNMMSSSLNLLPGINIPKEQTGKGTAYNVGNVLGDIGGFLAGGGALGAGRKAAEAIPYLGKIPELLGGEGVSGAARRALGNALGGYLTSEGEREKSAGYGAGASLALESLPLTLRGIGKFAETINPKQYAAKLAEEMGNQYAAGKKAASQFYNPVLDTFGQTNVTHQNPLAANFILPQDITEYFGPKVKKLYKIFENNRTLENAHDLQSQIGKEIGNLSGKHLDAYSQNANQAYQEAREKILNGIDAFLQNKNSTYSDMYQRGRDIMRNVVGPYRGDELIRNLVEGNVKTVQPKKMLSSLQGMSESGEIPQGHYLNEAFQNLNKKINKGEMIGNIAGMGLGTLLGEAVAPGLTGGAVGAGIGKFLTPSATQFVQNPELIKIMQHAQSAYTPAQQALIAALLGGNK